MQNISYIGAHHFGPIGTDNLSKSAHLVEADINRAHRNRWPDFPSELNGSFIGYNVIYWPDGSRTQYRYIGEETAAQKGHNFDTFSGCMGGNFTRGVELPTVLQKTKFRNDMKILLTNDPVLIDRAGLKIKPGTILNFSKDRIEPHRILQPNHTSCNGNSLSDSWARDLLGNVEVDEVQERKRLKKILRDLKQQFRELKRRMGAAVLGSGMHDCSTADVRG